MLGDSGAYASVGGKVLERAAGHACGAYDVPNVDIEARRRLHEQPALRRLARLRREPGRVRDGGRARHARREVRHRRAGRSASGTRSRSGSRSRPARSSRSRRSQEDAPGRQARVRRGRRPGKAVGHRLRHQEHRHRQRRRRVGQGSPRRRGGRDDLAPQRLHRDGPGPLHGPHPVRRRGDRGSTPRSSGRRRTSTFALGCGQTTGSRATLFGGSAVVVGGEEAQGRPRRRATSPSRRASLRRRRLIDDTTALGAKRRARSRRTPPSASRRSSSILDAEGKLEKRDRRPRRRARDQPELCAGQIEGSVHMGLGYALTEELSATDGMPVNRPCAASACCGRRTRPR